MNVLRARRLAMGLSQADVAAATGLSRQLVSAVESGRNVPSVAAALALAGVLQSEVADLFADTASTTWEPILGRAPEPGTPVRAVRVGRRGVYLPLPHGGASAEGWQAADGMVVGDGVDIFDERALQGIVVAGCDPVLRLVSELLPEAGPRRLVNVQATSVEAARALHRDRLHAAVVHGTPERLATPTPRSRSHPVARWRVGLAARSQTALDLERIASGEVTIAHRPLGAEAEKALGRAMAPFGGVAALSGVVASGHIAAARRAYEGSVDVALTMEPAASAFRLEFEPLEEHTVEIRVDERWLDHPGITSLLDLFGSPLLGRRLGVLGGYELLTR